mmetsp:Transcript_60028/g.160871  ORF Transcript_60028/g.160871 Transcript_60028/m.160871 type:complete len:524 (+) Transcript_60028:1771-3342(+)
MLIPTRAKLRPAAIHLPCLGPCFERSVPLITKSAAFKTITKDSKEQFDELIQDLAPGGGDGYSDDVTIKVFEIPHVTGKEVLAGLVVAKWDSGIFSHMVNQAIVDAAYTEVQRVVYFERLLTAIYILTCARWSYWERLIQKRGLTVDGRGMVFQIICLGITLQETVMLLIKMWRLRDLPARRDQMSRVLGYGKVAGFTLFLQYWVIVIPAGPSSNAQGMIEDLLFLKQTGNSVLSTWLGFMVLLMVVNLLAQFQSNWKIGKQILAISQAFQDFLWSAAVFLSILVGCMVAFFCLEGMDTGDDNGTSLPAWVGQVLGLFRGIVFADGDGLDQMVGKHDNGKYEEGLGGPILAVAVLCCVTYIISNISIAVVSSNYEHARAGWWLSFYHERARVAASVKLGESASRSAWEALGRVHEVLGRRLDATWSGYKTRYKVLLCVLLAVVALVCACHSLLLAASVVCCFCIAVRACLLRKTKKYLWVCHRVDFDPDHFLPEGDATRRALEHMRRDLALLGERGDLRPTIR